MGEIGILNVGAGDTKLVFDPSKPEDCARAARIVTDMLRKGFAILAQVGEHEHNGKKEPLYRRVMEFDEKTCEYIIASDQEVETKDGRSEAPETRSTADGLNRAGDRRGMHRRVPVERVAASKTRSVAVGRTAGG